MSTSIEKSTFIFLKDLKANNNKPWFDTNKATFLEAKKNATEFTEAVKVKLEATDQIEKAKLYRIYRDVRFSKDKTPYKHFMHSIFVREGAERRGGYWLGLEPGNTQVGGGFYAPEKDDLLRIRKEIEQNPEEFLKIINAPAFKKMFGTVNGDALKTSPKGFDKEHPQIKWINKKQFYVMRPFTDKEVHSDTFADEVVATFKGLRPFFNYMSNVLTTDLNGESIL